MNVYVFSASNNIFYLSAYKESYEKERLWPNDAVKISEDIFVKFTAEPPEGKMRGADKNGMPSWIDIPPPSQNELVSIANAEKQKRINQANEFMNSKQWPGKAAIGRLKGDDLVQYNLWLDYLDALDAVDTSTAPDIDWPAPPTS